jgi:hypothetical protein
MIVAATAVAENTMLITQFLPQKDAAFFGVVRLNKSQIIHT